MVRFTTFLFSLALLVGYQTAFAEKTRVGGSCENTYGNDEYCEIWADSGYCSSSSVYSDWMEANCEQSCNMCSPSAAPVSAPVAAPVIAPSASTCENVFYDSYCEYWAYIGYCLSSSQHSDYMEINCEQSCNMCPTSAPSAAPVTPSCENAYADDDTCEYWVTLGKCLYPSTTREWMETNCAQSCKMCTGVPSCENAYADDDACEDMAHAGACYKPEYSYWMYDHCRKSCKMCCKDPFDECQQRADNGDCSSSSQYSDWMATNCKNTCSDTSCIS